MTTLEHINSKMKKKNLKGLILVNVYSRDKEAKLCLNHISKANELLNLPILVVHQIGNKRVSQILKEYRNQIKHLIEIDGDNLSALENINKNRILGYSIGFDWMNCDWVLAVEEDTLIARDSIFFVEQIMERYHKALLFRGINLGSRQPFQSNLLATYSLLRYGMHGQASAITRKTWEHFDKKVLLEKSASIPFDSQIENYLKLGFMVTPNLSRYIDIGWNGTHAPKDPNSKYYAELKNSWVKNLEVRNNIYFRKDISHTWREDVEIYKFHKFFSRIYKQNFQKVKNFLVKLKTKSEN